MLDRAVIFHAALLSTIRLTALMVRATSQWKYEQFDQLANTERRNDRKRTQCAVFLVIPVFLYTASESKTRDYNMSPFTFPNGFQAVRRVFLVLTGLVLVSPLLGYAQSFEDVFTIQDSLELEQGDDAFLSVPYVICSKMEACSLLSRASSVCFDTIAAVPFSPP